MLAKIAYLESEVERYQDLALAIADDGRYDEEFEMKRINAINILIIGLIILLNIVLNNDFT